MKPKSFPNTHLFEAPSESFKKLNCCLNSFILNHDAYLAYWAVSAGPSKSHLYLTQLRVLYLLQKNPEICPVLRHLSVIITSSVKIAWNRFRFLWRNTRKIEESPSPASEPILLGALGLVCLPVSNAYMLLGRLFFSNYFISPIKNPACSPFLGSLPPIWLVISVSELIIAVIYPFLLL